MTANITYNEDGYRSLICGFLEVGFQFVSYGNVSPQQPQVVLRHDIDLSLKHAVRQAQVNQELGVCATFFMLLSADFYNLASAEGRNSLRAIVEHDQTLGLHFDASFHGQDADQLEFAAKREKEGLEKLSNCTIDTISFHRPVKKMQGLPGRFAGMDSAYEPRFFSDLDYCSDSRGRFYHGSPFARDAFANRKAFQLLTHPIWWMREQELAPSAVLLELDRDLQAKTRGNLAANSEPYRALMDGSASDLNNQPTI